MSATSPFKSKLSLLTVSLGLVSGQLIAQQIAPDSSSGTIEKITVQGEKTSRTLQETYSSVAVTTALKMEQENLVDLHDILNRTANVSEMYGSRGFTIRGIANEAGAPNPLATVYLDGAALPSQISDSGPTDLWDIQQVEILRGPQSTIQGENALSGAVIMRTTEPTMDWSAKARIQWSDPNDLRTAFAGGGALIEDELAFRVAVEKRDFDGYTKNVTLNKPEDEVSSINSKFKLLWTPKALPDLRALVSYMRDDRDGPYMYTYSTLDVDNYFDNRINLSNRENTTDIITDITNLELTYELSPDWTFSAITAHTQSEAQRTYDNDLTAVDAAYGGTEEEYDSLSQEIRLQYESDNLKALAGMYWSKRERDNYSYSLSNVDTPVSTISAVLQGGGLDSATAAYIANLYADALPVIPVDYISKAPSESQNRALFFDLEYKLSDTLSLLSGARLDKEKYTIESTTTANFAGTLPDPANYGPAGTPLNVAFTGINMAVLGLVADANGVTPASTRDFTAFLPKLGLRWNYHTDHSLALTIQRGYRSGGSAFNIARSEVFAYDPEFTTNYELAWRNSWLDNQLIFNSNLYYIDWQDKQVTAYFGANTYDYHTVNAGKAHLYGIEFELRHQLNNDIDWYASYAYSRTQYDQFETMMDATITDYAGQTFAYAPHHTAALGTNVYFSEQLALNLNASYRSNVTTGPAASEPVRLGSRTLVNARLSYDATNWSVYLFANNLFDKGYIQYRWPVEPNAIFGAPRVVGAGATWQY